MLSLFIALTVNVLVIFIFEFIRAHTHVHRTLIFHIRTVRDAKTETIKCTTVI